MGEGSCGQRKGEEKVKESQTELKFLLSCVLFRRSRPLGLGAQLGTSRHGSWLSCKFPVGIDGESPVSGAGQGGGQDDFRAAWERGIPRGLRGRGRRKPATKGTGSLTRECGLDLAGWAAPGLSTQGQEGFGLGAGSAALLQALAALAFQLTLRPRKQGAFPERKREPSGPRAVWGSHVSTGKPGQRTRQKATQRSVLQQSDFFKKGKREIRDKVCFK